MQFYKLCKRWRSEVDKNIEALAEMEKFKTKPIVTRMLDNISERIGLTNRIKYGESTQVKDIESAKDFFTRYIRIHFYIFER